jgi:hypothetical protein
MATHAGATPVVAFRAIVGSHGESMMGATLQPLTRVIREKRKGQIRGW